MQQHPLGTYYFRLVVPKAQKLQAGRKVIKYSLHTKDPAVAKMLAYLSAAHYLPKFRPQMTLDLKKLIAAAAGATRYDITTSDGFHIKTEGPEDHSRAMEALAQLLKGRGPNNPAPSVPLVSNPVLAPAKTYEVQEIITKYLQSIKDGTVKKTGVLKSEVQHPVF